MPEHVNLATCASCGSELPPNARFCPGCGAQQKPRCASCATELQSGARFCHGCGAPYANGQAHPAPSGAMHAEEPVAVGSSKEARKHVTIVFADIVGSTRLVAGLDPEDAQHFLTRSIEALSPAIEAAGGVVAKIMGDGMFCVFGAPLALEDHAYRACYAAMDLLSLADRLVAQNGSPVQLRVGLSSGTAVVNVTEGNGRVNLDAMGEVVNNAAHLEAAAAPGTVLISDATRRLAGYAIDARKLEEKDVFQLVSVGTSPKDILLENASAQSPFIGREREMNFFTAAVGQLSEGGGDIISVLGGAGLGKTRLLLEFSRQLQPTNIRMALASSRSLDQSDPNALLRRLVLGLLMIDPKDQSKLAQKIPERMVQLDESLAGHVDDVNWLLLSDSEETDPQKVEQRRISALTALKRVLTTLAAQGPLIIAIDNFQWSDASSRNFLKAVASMVDTEPLLLILFAREDMADFRPIVRQVLQLRPLDRATSAQLLLDQLADTGVSKSVVERVLDRAEGNPRFLTEFARHLAERGEPVDGQEAADEIIVPDSVADLFEERIDRLPEGARHLLQVGAAFEQPASLETLCALTDKSEDEMKSLLATVIDSGMVRETGFLPRILYTFVNPVVGEAAYRSLLRPERRRLHQKIYAFLEAGYHGRGRHSMMGRQALRAGLFEQAAQAYFEAGRRAGARLAYAESIDMLCQALQAEARVPIRTDEIDRLAIDIRLTLREGLFARSRFQDIETRLNEAQAICDRIGDTKRSHLVRRHLIGNAVAQGQLADALARIDILITDNRYLGEQREVAELQFLQAQILAALGRFEEAFFSARTVMEAFRTQAGSPHELSPVTNALARMWLIWCAAELGRFEEVKFEVLDCQNDLAHDRPPFFRILSGIATGLFWLRFGHTELAAETLQSVLSLTKEDENHAWFHSVASPLGLALIRMNRAEEALPLLQRSVAMESSGGSSRGTQAVHLAACWAALGDTRKGEDQARVAVARARQNGDQGVLAYALHTLGAVLNQTSQHKTAQACLTEALDIAENCKMRPLVEQISKDMVGGS
ncbi:AAA family ATPase [Ruegeria pomeroyi]|uniref:AAA family ATPase n=2 Tax=Ruegeria pomeroyi TaxID=89184 RepID=A0A9Q3ZP98_9RHOB|nr:AAA family ATPase [Ruegeria pomeroyi]